MTGFFLIAAESRVPAARCRNRSGIPKTIGLAALSVSLRPSSGRNADLQCRCIAASYRRDPVEALGRAASNELIELMLEAFNVASCFFRCRKLLLANGALKNLLHNGTARFCLGLGIVTLSASETFVKVGDGRFHKVRIDMSGFSISGKRSNCSA
jgi:hypothetical protein